MSNSVTKLICGKVRSYIGLSFLSSNAVMLSVTFVKSLKNGVGTFYSSNGSVKMDGIWQNGIAIDTKDFSSSRN